MTNGPCCYLCLSGIRDGETFRVVLINGTPQPVHPLCASANEKRTGEKLKDAPYRPEGS